MCIFPPLKIVGYSLTVSHSACTVRHTASCRCLQRYSGVLERGDLHPGTELEILAVHVAGMSDIEDAGSIDRSLSLHKDLEQVPNLADKQSTPTRTDG